MNIIQQKTLHQLTGNANLDEVPVGELFQLVNDYPYFSVAHFFLSKKLEEEKNRNFKEQLQKTVLYFNNPFWLHYQLTPIENAIKIINKNQVVEEETKPLLKRVIEEEIENFSKQSATTTLNKVEELEEKKQHTNFAPNIQIPSYERVTEIVTKIHENSNIDTQKVNEKVETEIVTKNIISPSITSFALQATEEGANEKNMEKDESLPQKNEIAEEVIEEKNVETNTEIAEEKIAAILKEQLAEFKKPVEQTAELEIETEPYHTVDYFASQGIKPDFANNQQDKLSKQLRKFTDWLREMKNNTVSEDDDLGTDPELENAIQGIAQTSNEAKEIVTETMAEVLEKQGKLDKAIQLYIKLSFLNPDKSTYFAAKIQKLKGI